MDDLLLWVLSFSVKLQRERELQCLSLNPSPVAEVKEDRASRVAMMNDCTDLMPSISVLASKWEWPYQRKPVLSHPLWRNSFCTLA